MNAKVKSVMSHSLKTTTKMANNITKTRHKKLDEDWFETREPIRDGMRFSAKYLGLTVVDEAKEDALSTAVQRIVTMAKGSKKRAVQLMISPQGIKVLDHTSSQLINEIVIQRISFCAALKNHMKVFAFVAQNEKTETMECHAYLCNTIKEAQTLTVTVAQSFKIAFEIDEELNSSKENTETEAEDSNMRAINGEKKPAPMVIPNMTEKRYQRFSSESNPFETSDNESNHPTVLTPKVKKIVELEENQPKTNGTTDVGNIFVFTSPLPTTTATTTPKSNTPITPLKPPPSNTRQSEKPSSRRLARPTSVGIPLPNSAILHQAIQTPSPSQSTPDVEDWDQGFADLALSRTQEKSSPVEAKQVETPTKNIIYPPSNPFFSPSNPFLS